MTRAPEGAWELGPPVPVTAAAGEPSSPAPWEVAWGLRVPTLERSLGDLTCCPESHTGPTALQRDVLFTQRRRTPGVLFKGRFWTWLGPVGRGPGPRPRLQDHSHIWAVDTRPEPHPCGLGALAASDTWSQP